GLHRALPGTLSVRQTIKVEGLRTLDQALGELPKATGKNVLRRVLLAAAKPIVDDAQARAPELKGALKRSHTAGTKLTLAQRRKLKKMARATVEVYAGPGGLAQATQQEFGNAHHRAQPFMRPAWDSKRMIAL